MSDIQMPKKCIVLSKKKLVCLYPTEVQKNFGPEISSLWKTKRIVNIFLKFSHR